MQLCFFEDTEFTNFHPLTLTRPVDDLRLGIFTIAQKWLLALETSNFSRLLRPNLNNVFDAGTIDEAQTCIWINSRYLPTKDLVKKITDLNEGQCLRTGDTIIAASVDGVNSAKWHQDGSPNFNNLFVLETSDYTCVSHLWDLFLFNGEQISNDLQYLQPASPSGTNISQHASLVNSDDIYIMDGATIEAGCILNATEGPIFIGEDATVMAGSNLRGPVAVCKGSYIKMGAKIYHDTTIGPICKVGGEVSNTIFHSYSNKAHDGYIGNSVIGQWCNFGAGTTVSNLKTNYSPIRITDWQSGDEIETGQQFFGVVMGDHTKTAINCVINSGSIFGVNCNILSRDFPPKFVDSFSWVGSNVIQRYKLDKAYEAMEKMMARRDVTFTDAYVNLMKEIFKQSR
ncbi:MAG TPA: putative sugar nucleotidyl transferase [Balneolaceae bacterium]|nr:putative sugar nucleotidyl transferase [Balneolaceae bacterium]